MTSRSLLLALTLLALPGITLADTTPTATPANGTSMPRHGHPDMLAMAQKNLDTLKQDLKLTDSQQAAWETYANNTLDQVRQAQKERIAMLKRNQNDTTSAPDHLQEMADRMTERAQMMTRTAESAKALYNQLTPDQQKTFDNDMALQRHRMMKHMQNRN